MDSGEVFLNGEWWFSNRTTYTYDENNNHIFSLIEEKHDSTWENSSRFFGYYTGNRVDSSRIQEWDNAWIDILSAHFQYENPEINNYTSVIVKRWNGSEWFDFQGSFKYDSSGNLEYNLWETWNGFEWIGNDRYFYSYNSSNLTTQGYCEIWDYNEWIPAPGVVEINWLKNYYRILHLTEKLYVYYPLTPVKENFSDEKVFTLFQNYPNPFNPSTVIEYEIKELSHVNIKVYDILGNEITVLVDEEKYPGKYSVNFNASHLSSGIYFYKLQAGGNTLVKSMMLMK